MAKKLLPATVFVLLAAFMLSGGALAKSKNEPAMGKNTIADGRVRVLPVVMTVRNTAVPIDTIVRVRQDGDFVGLCLAYLFRGPEHLWEDVKRAYPKSLNLLMFSPSEDDKREFMVYLGSVPGYQVAAGTTIAELNKKPMDCFATDMPWSPSYTEHEPIVRAFPRRSR